MPQEAYAEIIRNASIRWDVPENWIRAVIQTESAFNPSAYRAEPQINDGSYGLMQLLYSTAWGLGYIGSAAGLYDPATNIDLGTKLLSQLRDRYGNNIQRVYSAYNSGNPDLYLTSKQVGDNVKRLLSNLGSVATGSSGTIVLMLGLYFLLRRM